MTDTSLAANLDELSNRLIAGTTLKAVYTITGTEADDGSLRPVPQSIDSTPVGVLWFQGETVLPGNSEFTVDDIDLLIFERGTSGGYGYTTLTPFLDVIRPFLRTNLTNSGRATELIYRGAGAIYPETINNGTVYLVLPLHIQIKRIANTSAYSAT